MSKYSKIIFISSCLSLLVSLFTELTKRKMESDSTFVPFCDFEESKCSNVLKSEYSTGFGFNFLPDVFKISNSLYGMVFYAIIASLSKKHFSTFDTNLTLNKILLGFSNKIGVVEIQLFLSSVGIWICIWLTYVLLYIIKDLCILCISLHLLNVITIIFIVKKYRYSLKMQKTKVF